MNKFLIYISLGVLSLTATSCLNLDPKDQLADPDLWNTPGDFENFANKFYDYLPNFSQVYDGNIHSDMKSDLLVHKDGKNSVSNGTYNMGASDGDYSNSYHNIRRCCLLLDKAAGYDNPAEIRQAVGEAYFFRAWNHFFLVQKFGDVIIVDHPLDVDDPLLFAKRDDRGKVVDFIIDDLRHAADQMKRTSDLPEGKIGWEGAKAFLSRVALYEGTWQKFRGNEARAKELLDIAAKAAKDVIDSKAFEIFQPSALGTEAYKYMFILENTLCNPAKLQKSANKEYIIKRCFDMSLKTVGNNLTTTSLANAWWATSKLADMYLCADGLPIDKSALFQGYGMKSEWANRDNRMSNTLMRPGGTFWNNSKNNCRIDWSGSDEELARAKYKDYKPGATGYMLQKWATERECADGLESYDFPVLRYAEVLLNYAEAVYERDDAISDNDLEISINVTRKRVNKSMPRLTNAFVAQFGLDMREEIRRERTVELFQEGFRIDDLKRWKTAESEMPMDITGYKWVGEWKTGIGDHGKYQLNAEDRIVIETGRVFEQKHYLYPLPVDQQQLNPNLGQNPGWPKATGSYDSTQDKTETDE